MGGLGWTAAGVLGMLGYGFNKEAIDKGAIDTYNSITQDPVNGTATTAKTILDTTTTVLTSPVRVGESMRGAYDVVAKPEDTVRKLMNSTAEGVSKDGGSSLFNSVSKIAPYAVPATAGAMFLNLLPDFLTKGLGGGALKLGMVTMAATWIWDKFGEQIADMVNTAFGTNFGEVDKNEITPKNSDDSTDPLTRTILSSGPAVAAPG